MQGPPSKRYVFMINVVELIGGVEVKSGRIVNSREVRLVQERLICNAIYKYIGQAVDRVSSPYYKS
jgi:hypothetical protein